MKILMLSTDPKVFEEDSVVSLRLKAYGALTDGLYVLVSAGGLREKKILKLSPKVTCVAVPAPARSLRPLGLVREGLKLRREAFSLITAQDPFEIGFAGVLLSALLKLPLQVQVHTDFLNPYFSRGSLLNHIRVFLAGFVLPRAHSVRAVSERIKNGLLKRYGLSPEKITVLPISNPPSEAVEAIDLKEKYPNFSHFSLLVSRLEPEKNISGAIKAFASVSAKYPQAALVIVGEGSERSYLQNLVLKRGLWKRVFFEGWQDPHPYYRAADLFVSNSLYEGYGLSLLEAALAGCPILTTNVGLVGEVLTEEGAVIVPPGDQRGLERAWENALLHPEFLGEKTRRAKEAAEEHSKLSGLSYAEAVVALWRRACA